MTWWRELRVNPLLAPDDPHTEDASYGQLVEEQEQQAESLRVAWHEGGADPLPSTLARLRQERLRLEADMRLLIAYGSRFTHPRPYKRHWYASTLAYGHQARAASSGDPDGARALSFATMGYPAALPR
jgi:hypothetical protein